MPWNEFDIIERVFKRGTTPGKDVITGIGDDAALIRVPEGQLLAVSTDTLVNGIHFPENASPADVGYKSLAVNLSDMAAMGAAPRWATLSLSLPHRDESWIEGFAEGFFQLATAFGVELVGGDLSHGPLSITVQIMGTVPVGAEIKRSGASPGDSVYVTGNLGMASLALSLLQGTIKLDGDIPVDILQRLNRPSPRVDAGLALRSIATAAIDISDGLAGDLGHLLSASGCGAEINLGDIPLHDGLLQLDSEQRWRHVLNLGDDYELCFTATPGSEPEIAILARQLDYPVTRIGCVIMDKEIVWKDSNGQHIEQQSSGFLHF